MTVTSGEGAEYLVVNVSEKLSSLACAMSNGKIDLWNLDQVSDRNKHAGRCVRVGEHVCFRHCLCGEQ